MSESTSSTFRELSRRALGRTTGARLIAGNRVDLLIDGRSNFDAWLEAIAGARDYVLLENYIVRNDRIGRRFLDALTERAAAGVTVCVICDWLGCLGQSRHSFWRPLVAAGGQLRVYNPPRLMQPLTLVSRDHRKLLSVDGRAGFLSGVCVSARWLGDAERGVPPWRDTGIRMHGPAVAELERAFAESWGNLGSPLPATRLRHAEAMPADGPHAVRVIATQPNTASVYRMDQLVAAIARKSLWLTDAYFVGMAPYVQALAAAARDGVDVRLLVPGSSDLPVVSQLSRAGYRPLLQAGVRVFEWNGSMLHAKTAVADGRWARVGSSNLNVSSWLGNRELDIAVEDRGFAADMAEQYEQDLQQATEIVLAPRPRRRGTRVHAENERPPRPRRAGGSSSRAAAGAVRLANTVGAALTNRRVLDEAETGPLLGGALVLLALGAVSLYWPMVLGWPMAVIVVWFGVSLARRWLRLRLRRRKRKDAAQDDA